MAVSSTATDYSGLGTGASATYGTGIYANASDQIKVYANGVLQTLGVNYSLNGIGAGTGVNVVGSFANGATVYIERVTPITQLVDTQNNETILEDVLDAEFDKLTMIAQEANGKINRALLVPKGEAGATIPAVASRAGKALAFDAAGDPVALAVGASLDASLRADLAAATGAALIGKTGGGSVQAGLDALVAADAAFSPRIAALETLAPYNLAPNSQWEICSGLTYATRWKADGTGTMASMSVTSHTFNTNEPVVTVAALAPGLKVGDVVKMDNTGTLQAVMYSYPVEIIAIAGSTFTVRLPTGLKPTASGTGGAAVVNIGGSASAGTGDAADGWKKSTTLYVWREDNDANVPAAALYSLGCSKQSGGEEYVRHEMDIARFAGKTITFGMLVSHKIKGGAGTWKLFIEANGTGGTVTNSAVATVASSAFQWLEVTATIPMDATYAYCGVKLNGLVNDVYYLANPVLAAGSRIGANNYTKPREALVPLAKVEPWINRTVDFTGAPNLAGYGYWWADSIHAGSGMMIAKSVKHMTGNIEGIDAGAVVTGAGGSRVIGFADGTTGPIRLGSVMAQYVQDVKSFVPLDLYSNNGYFAIRTAVLNDSWSNVSIDLNCFYLE